jgi:hypothetical protein
MVEYIPLCIFRSSFKFSMGDKLREKMEGERDETFFSAFYWHKPIQIVFFKNFENCGSPFKNETLHQENSKEQLESCNV